MERHVILLMCFVSLPLILCDSQSDIETIEECLVWDQVIQSMQEEENVNMRCFRNAECSGLDCLGEYAYKGLFAEDSDITARFCFGMVIEPCTTPTMMQIYIGLFKDSGNTTTDTTAQVSQDMELPVNGANFDVFGQSAQPQLNIKMNHTVLKNKPHIFLSIRMEVVVHVNFWGMEGSQTLDGMGVQIVDPIYIPVPPCDPRVGNHTRSKGQCSWSPTFNVTKPERKGSMTPCKGHNDINECNKFEMCDNGKCVCIPPYEFRVEGKNASECVGVSSREFDLPDIPESTGSNKNVITIACSVVGAVVFICIAVVLVIKIRKHRSRYAGMQRVMTEDNDDDLEVNA